MRGEMNDRLRGEQLLIDFVWSRYEIGFEDRRVVVRARRILMMLRSSCWNDASDISVDTRNFVNGTKVVRVYIVYLPGVGK